METRATAPAKARSVDASVLAPSERPSKHAPAPEIEHKAAGYGLPCSKCRAYYPADLDRCPICKSAERVSAATGAQVPIAQVVANGESAPVLEDERERFLRELKSQVFASHTQINAAATFRCVLEQNHTGDFEPAAVCHTCYGDVRQQADRLEAALHIDVKEAAQIVYNAVWADTSDPSKTYLNAANALLTELRNRAGLGTILGPNQPLTH